MHSSPPSSTTSEWRPGHIPGSQREEWQSPLNELASPNSTFFFFISPLSSPLRIANNVPQEPMTTPTGRDTSTEMIVLITTATPVALVSVLVLVVLAVGRSSK